MHHPLAVHGSAGRSRLPLSDQAVHGASTVRHAPVPQAIPPRVIRPAASAHSCPVAHDPVPVRVDRRRGERRGRGQLLVVLADTLLNSYLGLFQVVFNVLKPLVDLRDVVVLADKASRRGHVIYPRVIE